MLALYTFLLYLLLPFVLLRLLWRGIKVSSYRQRWRERFGLFDSHPAPGGIWVHAVSVGETQAVEPLVRRLMKQYPEIPIVITTSTPTGSERVKKLFGDTVFHVYYPYDIPWCIENFLQRVKPRMLLMVETEIWPNMLTLCQQHHIPTLLANGRLSVKSARGYARLGAFTRETFNKISLLAVQSQADADRFTRLGLPKQRIEVTGSIKFDMNIPASVQEQTQVVRRSWVEGRPVWVAASTHEGEEEQVLQAHELVLKANPGTLLVIVPRHPERFDRVAALVEKHGMALVRRSANQPCSMDTQVFLGDSMGELPVFLGAADMAFIGGSLVKTGGHNMLEASAQGVAVTFGPNVFNFPAIAALLQKEEAAVQVKDYRELGQLVTEWLTNASQRTSVGENGRRVVEANRGALERLLVMVETLLEHEGAG